MTTELSTLQLPELEKIIDRGLASFIEVGNALIEIRDAKMYGSEYATFDEYVDKRFGLTRQRAYQLIDATKTVTEMSTVVGAELLPTNERQARALAEVADTPAKQARVMKKAAKSAPKDANGKPRITAAAIHVAAEALNGTAPTVAKAAGMDPVQDRLDQLRGGTKPKAEPKPPVERKSEFDAEELEAKSKSLVVDKTLSLAERITAQNKMIDAFNRLLMKTFDDNLPSDPWLDEGQVTIARDQLKSCCGAIKVAKAHSEPCPKCDGKGCAKCRKCGYLPKNSYEMIGGK